MFSRIRYAARVLSYHTPKPNKFEEPDIVFEEESRAEISEVSKFIGNFIEVVIIVGTVGIAVVPTVHFLFPAKEAASLATISGILAGLSSILFYQMVNKLHGVIRLKLKMGERIAPYFGHKIARAIQALRG